MRNLHPKHRRNMLLRLSRWMNRLRSLVRKPLRRLREYQHEEPQEEAPGYEEPVAAAEEPAPQEAQWAPPAEEAAPAEEWAASHHDEAPVEEYHVPAHEQHEYAPAVEPEPAIEPEPLRPANEYNPSNRLVEPFVSFAKPEEFVEHSREEPLQAETAAHFDPVWTEPAAETPAEPPKDAEVAWAAEEVRNFSGIVPPADSTNDAARAFEEAIAGLPNAPQPAKMPAANEGFSWEAAAFDDLPPIEAGQDKKRPVAAQFDDADLFEDIHGRTAAPAADVPGDEWQEAKALRGYDRRGVVAEDDDAVPSDGIDHLVATKLQNKNFRMEPKRRRFGVGTVITILAVLAVLGGGGYAAWMNRAQLVAMIDGLVSAAPSRTADSEPATATGDQSPAAPRPTPRRQNRQKMASRLPRLMMAPQQSNKFTQRLMADGTEVDNGPAANPGTPTAEGKSISEQNVASAAPAAAPQTSAPQPNADAERPGRCPSAAGTRRCDREDVPLRRTDRPELADGDPGIRRLERSA